VIVTPTKYFWQRTTFTSVEEYFMASTVLYCVCILLDMYVGHPTSSFVAENRVMIDVRIL